VESGARGEEKTRGMEHEHNNGDEEGNAEVATTMAPPSSEHKQFGTSLSLSPLMVTKLSHTSAHISTQNSTLPPSLIYPVVNVSNELIKNIW